MLKDEEAASQVANNHEPIQVSPAAADDRIAIHYCSAPCGSGKTFQALQMAYDLARRGIRVLLVQPTTELNEKSRVELQSKFPPDIACHVFNSETGGRGNVASTLLRYARKPPDRAEIILSTHQLLPFLNEFEDKSSWHLIVDEQMQVLNFDVRQVPEHFRLITDHIELEAFNSIYSRVAVPDPDLLSDLVKNNQNDEVVEFLVRTLMALGNSHNDRFVNSEKYQKLMAGQDSKLTLYSVLRPSIVEGFGSVFMTAANFESSAVFRLWAEDAQFVPDDDFRSRLRFSQHQNGDLITIYYGTDKHWSKYLLNQTPKNASERVIDAFTRTVGRLFEDSPAFLWQMNKSTSGDVFGSNGHRMPNKPHGLNIYSDINDIAFLSALNPTTDQFRFLDAMGMSGDEVREVTYFEAAYQAVMRTSIRNPDNHHPKRIVVPDRALAEYLVSLFPGAAISKIDLGISDDLQSINKTGRKKLHDSSKERVAEFRKKERLVRSQLLEQQLGLVGASNECNETSLRSVTRNVTFATSLTVYRATTSCYPEFYIDHHSDHGFIKLIHGLSSLEAEDKETHYVISPAVFVPDPCQRSFKKESNIIHLRHVFLDFEDGSIDPDEFANLFPKTRMVITNTFNHTSSKPRFRVIILTSKPMTPDVYRHVYDQIALKLEDAGYYVETRTVGRLRKAGKPSGLDWSKRTPTSVFKAPCLAKDSSQSFFIDYSEGRMALDPVDWVKNSIVKVNHRACTKGLERPEGERNEKLIQSAKDDWRAACSLPNGGNSRFYLLGCTLYRAGMDLDEIKAELYQEARYARSPERRKAQVKSIISSLKKMRGY